MLGFGKDENHKPVHVSVSRRKANIFNDSGKVDTTGSFTVFGQVFSALESQGYGSLQNFRQTKLDAQPFKIKFVGERSIDVGGPFRDSLFNIS